MLAFSLMALQPRTIVSLGLLTLALAVLTVFLMWWIRQPPDDVLRALDAACAARRGFIVRVNGVLTCVREVR